MMCNNDYNNEGTLQESIEGGEEEEKRKREEIGNNYKVLSKSYEITKFDVFTTSYVLIHPLTTI